MILTTVTLLALAIIAILARFLWRERDFLRKENIRLSQEKERLETLVFAIDGLCMELTAQKRKALEGYRELIATYTVTESDMIKYATDEEMEERIQKTLLKTIVYDAIKDADFTPEVSVNINGRKVYCYHFYLKQV